MMVSSSMTSCDRGPDRNVPEGLRPSRTPDHSWADSLKRVVRRILRTQSRRTWFEARVLDEARRFLEGCYCDTARDVLERFVVEQLLQHQDSPVEFAAPRPLCPATHLAVSHSTFTGRPDLARG